MGEPVPTRKHTQTGLQSVLVAVGSTDIDRLDSLVEETTKVAGPSDATVTLVHVFSPEGFEGQVDALDFDQGANDVSPDDVAERHLVIRRFAARLAEHGVDYDIRGAIGAQAKEDLTALAEEIDADRIVVGGRKRSPTGKAVFGSLAQGVMLSAPCPVTFVRADTE